MKYDKKIIGQRIHKLRKSYRDEKHPRGLNQVEFGCLIKGSPASGSGYDRGTVAAWENGSAQISLDSLFEICDFFNCELGYLLGEHEEKTRAATDITEHIGLSEAAIEKLHKYKMVSDKTPGNAVNSNSADMQRLKLRESINKERFIPELISYMIEDPSLEKISDRMCSELITAVQYGKLSDQQKELISLAYNKAYNETEMPFKDNVTILQERYFEAVDRIMNSFEGEPYEDLVLSIYGNSNCADSNSLIDEIKRQFFIARNTSEDIKEMNSFLNQRALFEIVNSYASSISRELEEVK